MKTRYVYFNKNNGQITDILNKRKRGRAPYVECDVEDVVPFLSGKKGINEAVVAYNTQMAKYVILGRNNIIKLRYYKGDFLKIPNKKTLDFDIRLILYSEVLEVSINPVRMSTFYATNLRDEVVFEKGTEIRIYVKDKEGQTLLKTLIIDAQQLLDNMQMFFDMEGIDQSDISFYTERIFEKYIWYKGTLKFLSPLKEKIKFEIQKADQKRKRDDYEYHLILREEGDVLYFVNNIEDIRLVKIFDNLEFFIVDMYDPIILYEKFYLEPDDFNLKKIPLIVNTKTIKGKGILYNHEYISVLIEGNINE